MGFQRKRKLYPLDFAGTDLEGLTMIMLGLSVEEYLDLTSLQDTVKASTSEQVQKMRELFDKVAGKIHEWDLVDEAGNEIEPSGAELLSWDFGDAMAAVDAWMTAVGDVADPLERKSSDGNKWVGPPIPMDIPSPNLPSS